MIVQQRPYVYSPGLYGNPMSMGMYSRSMEQNPFSANLSLDQGKGKGKQADFEAAFAEYASPVAETHAETSRIEEVDDDIQNIAESLKNTSLESTIEQGGTDFTGCVAFLRVGNWTQLIILNSIWDQLQNSDLPPPQEEMAKWEAEFNQLMSSQREELDFDYGGDMQKAWESSLGNYEGIASGPHPTQFDEEGLPLLAEYEFGMSD
jgi:peroxin-5